MDGDDTLQGFEDLPISDVDVPLSVLNRFEADTADMRFSGSTERKMRLAFRDHTTSCCILPTSAFTANPRFVMCPYQCSFDKEGYEYSEGIPTG